MAQNSNVVTVRALIKKYRYAPFHAVPHQDTENRGHITGQKSLSKSLQNSPHRITKDSEVVLTHGLRLHKDDERDQCIIAFLKVLEEVAPRFAEANPEVHLFYLEDIEQEAEISVDQDELMMKAFDVITQNKSLEKMRNIVYFLQRDPEGMTEKIMKKLIYDTAKTEPQRIINSIANNGKHKIFLSKLYFKGIITRKGGMYMHGETMIGKDEEDAILFIMNPKNKNLVDMLGDNLMVKEGKSETELDKMEVTLPNGEVESVDEARADELLKEYSLQAPAIYRLNGKVGLLNKHFDTIKEE